MARPKTDGAERTSPLVDPASVALLVDGTVSEPDADQTQTIAEVAAEFGVSQRALRFYESLGLLQPTREGTRRLYTTKDRRCLRIILLGQAIGFSLNEIRRLIAGFDGARVGSRQMDKLIKRFEDQRAFLIDSQLQAQRSIDTMNAVMAILKGVQRKP